MLSGLLFCWLSSGTSASTHYHLSRSFQATELVAMPTMKTAVLMYRKIASSIHVRNPWYFRNGSKIHQNSEKRERVLRVSHVLTPLANTIHACCGFFETQENCLPDASMALVSCGWASVFRSSDGFSPIFRTYDGFFRS
jgi:hypothetical protein